MKRLLIAFVILMAVPVMAEAPTVQQLQLENAQLRVTVAQLKMQVLQLQAQLVQAELAKAQADVDAQQKQPKPENPEAKK